MKLAATLMALPLLMSAPSMARDNSRQDGEGAAKFSAILFDKGIVVGRSDYQDPRANPVKFVILRSDKTDKPCFTAYRYRWSTLDESITEEGQGGIDWTKVSEARATGTMVTVTSPLKRSNYDFGSADMATRAAYAMEFIRTACDGTAGTGF